MNGSTATCHICGTIAREVFSKNGYNIHTCPSCSLRFVHPIPEDTSSVYQKGYFVDKSGEHNFGYTDYDSDKEPMRDVFVSYLRRIEDMVKGQNVFDVGAATGYFLDVARDHGWQTSGIEISDYAGTVAKEKGHDVVVGSFDDVDVAGMYDVVTMWDVIEHVKDPRAVIEKVASILKKGGVLAINTPNVSSMYARLMRKAWHMYIPPEHLFYFSPKTIRKLLEESGFSVLEIKTIGKKFSLAYIFGILYHWQHLSVWKWLAHFFDTPFWRRVRIPINLRDNMFILAQKQ